MSGQNYHPGPFTPRKLNTRLVVTDLDSGITGQLIANRLIAVPFHLSLVDGENRSVPSDRDDVTLAYFLRNMGTSEVNVFVIGVIRLSFLFDHRPTSHGGPESQRANSHTQH
jgi:hypothetical protein